MTTLQEAVRRIIKWDDEMKEHKEKNKYRLTDVALFHEMLDDLRSSLSEAESQPKGQVTRELEDLKDNLITDNFLIDAPSETHLQTLRSIIELSKGQDVEAGIYSRHVLAYQTKLGKCPDCESNVYHEASCSSHGWTPEPENPSEEQVTPEDHRFDGVEEAFSEMIGRKVTVVHGEGSKVTGVAFGPTDDEEGKAKEEVEGDADPDCSGCGKPMSEHGPDMPDYVRRLLSQDLGKMVELQGEEKQQVLDDLGKVFADRASRGGSRADSPLMGQRERKGHDDLPSPNQLVERVEEVIDSLLEVTESHHCLAEQVLRIAKGIVGAGGYDSPEARIKDIESGLALVNEKGVELARGSGGVIGDLNARVEELRSEVDGLQAVSGSTSSRLTMLADRVVSDRETLVDKVNALESSLLHKAGSDNVERQLSAIRSEVEENTAHLALVREHMEVEESMVVRLVTTDQRALDLKEEMEEVQRRAAVLEGHAAGTIDRLGRVDEQVGILGERLDRMEGRMTSFFHSVANLQPGMKELGDDPGQTDSIDRLVEQAGALEQRVARGEDAMVSHIVNNSRHQPGVVEAGDQDAK